MADTSAGMFQKLQLDLQQNIVILSELENTINTLLVKMNDRLAGKPPSYA